MMFLEDLICKTSSTDDIKCRKDFQHIIDTVLSELLILARKYTGATVFR